MMLEQDKTYLIDLDGTMYQGDTVIPEALEFIEHLQRNQIAYLFVTNNAMRTPKEIMVKMHSMGFRGLKETDFFTSAMAAISHMKKTSAATHVFFIGEEGLRQAILRGGYVIDETAAQLVFVGLDTHADYSLYCKAARCIKERHALLIGTNSDRRIPQGDHFLIGNGAILQMLAYATEANCITIGKPNAIMMEEVLAYLGKTQHDCVVLGDNLETDIAFAKNNGVKSILVCSGVHTQADAERFSITPDLMVDSLRDLLIK